MVDKHTTYILKQIETDGELQQVRVVRNECRLFMTRNTKEISEIEQRAWYCLLDKQKNKIFLLLKFEHGVIMSVAGYGLVRQEGGVVVLSGGLTESCRGQGVGEILFTQLIEEAKKFNQPIWLEVLKTNINAHKLYEKLGFENIGEKDDIIIMEYVE